MTPGERLRNLIKNDPRTITEIAAGVVLPMT